MNDEVIFTNQPDYLFVEVHCEWTVDNAKMVVDRTRAEAERCSKYLVLVDLTRWSSPSSEMVRYSSGEYLARVLPPPFKVASFAEAKLINKFGENTAVNRGASYRIFPSRSAATEWLMTDCSTS